MSSEKKIFSQTDQGWTSTFDKQEESKFEESIPIQNEEVASIPKQPKKKVKVKRSLSKRNQDAEADQGKS